jgi:hypothetical protein
MVEAEKSTEIFFILFLTFGLWQPEPGLYMHLMMKFGQQLREPSHQQLSQGLESWTLFFWDFHEVFRLMIYLPLMSQLWKTPLLVPPF